MKTSYFTLGQTHTHRVKNVTLDKDIVVKITAENPREVMFSMCGDKWGFEYDKEPNMSYFSRGIIDLSPNTTIEIS